MKVDKKHIASATALIESAHRDGYEEGILTGLQVAERIAVWWKVNSQLAEPESVETLTRWTDEAIEKLKLNIK